MLSPSSGIHPAMKTSACTCSFPTAAWNLFRQPGHQLIAPGLLAVASVRATVFRYVPAGRCSSMIRRTILIVVMVDRGAHLVQHGVLALTDLCRTGAHETALLGRICGGLGRRHRRRHPPRECLPDRPRAAIVAT